MTHCVQFFFVFTGQLDLYVADVALANVSSIISTSTEDLMFCRQSSGLTSKLSLFSDGIE